MSAVQVPERDGGDGTLRRRMHAVFVSDFLHVPVPFAQLVVVLLDKDAAWLRRVGAASSIDGDEDLDPSGVATVTMRIGPDARARQSVIVTAGKARLHQRAVIVPIAWEPVGFRHLLPTLDADLELSELDDCTSRLAISGSYRVPFGRVGLGFDNVAMHRLAEATMRSFLKELCDAFVAAR